VEFARQLFSANGIYRANGEDITESADTHDLAIAIASTRQDY
jgi:hypothetical protein